MSFHQSGGRIAVRTKLAHMPEIGVGKRPTCRDCDRVAIIHVPVGGSYEPMYCWACAIAAFPDSDLARQEARKVVALPEPTLKEVADAA